MGNTINNIENETAKAGYEMPTYDTAEKERGKLIPSTQRKQYKKATPNTLTVNERDMFNLVLAVSKIKNRALPIAVLSIIITICGGVVVRYITNHSIDPEAANINPIVVALSAIGFIGGTIVNSLLGKVKNKKEIESAICCFYQDLQVEYESGKIVFNKNGNIDFKATRAEYDKNERSQYKNSFQKWWEGLWDKGNDSKKTHIILLPFMLLVPFQAIAYPFVLSKTMAFSENNIDRIISILAIVFISFSLLYLYIQNRKMSRKMNVLLNLYNQKTTLEKRDPEWLYKQAKVYLMDNRVTSAINLLNEAISINPNNLRYYELRADAYIQNGDLEKSTEDNLWVLSKVKKDSEKLRVYHKMAIAYNDFEDIEKANDYYKKAFDIIGKLESKEIALNYKEILNTLNDFGSLLIETEQFDQAEEVFRQAETLCNSNKEESDESMELKAMTQNNHAYLLRKESDLIHATEKYIDALKIYRKLGEKNSSKYLSDISIVLNNLGNIYRLTKHTKEAEELFVESLEIQRKLATRDPDKYNSTLADTLNDFANLYKDIDIDKALKFSQEALRIRRELVEYDTDAFLNKLLISLTNLAELFKADNKLDKYDEYNKEALSILQQLIEKSPEDIKLIYQRATLYEKTGDIDKAIQDLNLIVRNNPDDGRSYYSRGLCYFHKMEYTNALKDFDEAINRGLNDASIFGMRGVIHGFDGEYDKSIEDFTVAIEKDKANELFHYNRGVTYSFKGDHDKAIADYTEAIRLKPDYVDAYYNRGNAYDDKGDHDKAIADYTEAIRLKPDDAEAYNNRGNTYGRKGDHDKAIADHTEAIRLKPDSAKAYYNRGVTYSFTGDHDKAIADYTEAIRLKPDYTDAYHNRGNEYDKKGDYDKAISDYMEAIRLKPDDAETYNNIADTLCIKKDFERAIPYADKAIELEPDESTCYGTRCEVYMGLEQWENALNDAKLGIEIAKRKGETDVIEVLEKKTKDLEEKIK